MRGDLGRSSGPAPAQISFEDTSSCEVRLSCSEECPGYLKLFGPLVKHLVSLIMKDT